MLKSFIWTIYFVLLVALVLGVFYVGATIGGR